MSLAAACRIAQRCMSLKPSSPSGPNCQSLGCAAHTGSAIRHRIEDGVGVDELLVVVLGAVAGVQIEAVRQREALDVDTVAFAAVFDLEDARRLPVRHQMRRGGQLRFPAASGTPKDRDSADSRSPGRTSRS